MNERVTRLRNQSRNAHPTLSAERAQLMTQFYRSGATETYSIPVARALAFKYVLEHKHISIAPEELIVGEHGPLAKSIPTYPELICHGLEDLHQLEAKTTPSLMISKNDYCIYETEVIPYWSGKTMQAKVFGHMDPAWQAAYQAGVFTEPLCQGSLGHAQLGSKLYEKGMLDIKQEIAHDQSRLDYLNDPHAFDKDQHYQAMAICIDAIIHFAKRHAHLARALMENEPNEKRRHELEHIATVCTQVPAHAPRNFWEALQATWFVYLCVLTELYPSNGFGLGRLDQHLWPFYRDGLATHSLTSEQVEELLQCFWIKFNNQLAPPMTDSLAIQPMTSSVTIGGVDPQNGTSAVNDLSYLILDVTRSLALSAPHLQVQISKTHSHTFLAHTCDTIIHSQDQLSVWNAELLIQDLLREGVSIRDARNGGPNAMGIAQAYGKAIQTPTGAINAPKVLELTLHNGLNPATKQHIGLKTGDPLAFDSYLQLFQAYQHQLAHVIDMKVKGNNIIERLFANHLPVPFLSLLIDDCIAQGCDINIGGGRYQTNTLETQGINTVTDALGAIQYHVFEQKTLTLGELIEALSVDFQGYDSLFEALHDRSPQYGHDDPVADHIAAAVLYTTYDLVNDRHNTRGGSYRVAPASKTIHTEPGAMVGALPGAHHARTPIHDGHVLHMDAQNHDIPNLLHTLPRLDHARTGGTLLILQKNQDTSAAPPDSRRLARLIQTYFTMDGCSIRFTK